MKRDIKKILKQRGSQYGKFCDQAAISQALKDVARATPGWSKLDADMKECIEMTLHKIARILNGNPKFEDSWRDQAGYSTLVADRLLGVKQ